MVNKWKENSGLAPTLDLSEWHKKGVVIVEVRSKTAYGLQRGIKRWGQNTHRRKSN